MIEVALTLQRWIRAALLAAASTICLSGCLRQTGAAALEPRRPVAEGPDDSKITETDRVGGSFMLGGQPFCFLGTNNYYVSFKSKKMTDDVLESAKAMGLKVIRVWGYIDKGKADGSGSVDGTGDKEGVYFQYWDAAKNRPAYNDGPTGLEHLDYVLDKAQKLDLKVMVVLTNNWRDFGGMDQYLTWYGLKQHHLFYSDKAVVGAFKDYTAHLVSRKNSVSGVVYRDDPTIFGWELANEPRCTSGHDFDDRSACKIETTTAWADDMSTYIKSIDKNHLVSVGDEGFFAKGGGFGYDGGDGVDHAAFLALPHIDFGTYHLYPDGWGQGIRWGNKWIQDHIELAQSLGKPTLLEEYGVVARRNDAMTIIDGERRQKAYPRWHEILLKRGGNAALFWMLGGADDHQGKYPDFDHFTVYAGDPTAKLMTQLALQFPSEGQACRLFRKIVSDVPASKFVTVAGPQRGHQALLPLPSRPPT